MRKSLFILTYLLIVSSLVYAKEDSVFNTIYRLNIKANEDVTNLNMLIDKKDFFSAYELNEKLKTLYKKEEYLYNKAVIQYNINNFEDSKKALEAVFKIEINSELKSRVLLLLIDCSDKLQDFESVITYCQQYGLKQIKKLSRINSYIKSHIFNQTPININFYIEFIVKEKRFEFTTLDYIAAYYARFQMYENSVKYLIMSNQLNRVSSYAIYQLVQIYTKFNQYNKAIEYCEKAISEVKENKNRFYDSLINLYFYKNQYDKLIALIDKNKKVNYSENSLYLKYLVYFFKGDYHKIRDNILNINFKNVKVARDLFNEVKERFILENKKIDYFILKSK